MTFACILVQSISANLLKYDYIHVSFYHYWNIFVKYDTSVYPSIILFNTVCQIWHSTCIIPQHSHQCLSNISLSMLHSTVLSTVLISSPLTTSTGGALTEINCRVISPTSFRRALISITVAPSPIVSNLRCRQCQTQPGPLVNSHK